MRDTIKGPGSNIEIFWSRSADKRKTMFKIQDVYMLLFS